MILRLMAGGVGGGFLNSLCGKTVGGQPEVSSTRGHQIDEARCKSEIVEEAYRLGHQYEAQHGGCAQCTLAALQDAIPFLEKDADVFRAASGLDGGATPTGVQNCGAFTGAGMAIGCLCGRRRDTGFAGSNKQAHRLIRKLYEQFEEHYGSVLCKDVREKAERRCPEVVGLAAKWTAQILLDEFGVERDDNPRRPLTPEHDEESNGGPGVSCGR
ncbi:MAG: C-GCAxxG-C-C family protein [Pirellulales bacterium]|jgi:C_GCAxxG_C_C family probable redox protein|nr:C-GCAxxG-C-C family protein [Thermoguttaceae bacterium]MDD4787655.1 C-GCAxxG-C-C family protein [Pirellulales bacterium]MDI9445103.1 C-GCAxxG-C-C family protein [Planctomycetota bacterium]NLZ02724.1 C_GCAxxG_C_C family protein [Pirellulaceae bacterium]